MVKPLERGLGGPESWVGQGLRELPGRANSHSQVDGDSDIVPAYWLRGRSAQRGTMASASTSVWEKAAPPALVLMTDNSGPPHMSLVPFAPGLELRGSQSE